VEPLHRITECLQHQLLSSVLLNKGKNNEGKTAAKPYGTLAETGIPTEGGRSFGYLQI